MNPTTSGVHEEDYNLWKAKSLTEKRFMDIVIASAERHGWIVYHTFDSRRSAPGYPDLHLVHPVAGRSVFAELKRQTGGRTTPAQRKWLDALRGAGCEVYEWRPLDWFDNTIPRLLVGEVAEP